MLETLEIWHSRGYSDHLISTNYITEDMDYDTLGLRLFRYKDFETYKKQLYHDLADHCLTAMGIADLDIPGIVDVRSIDDFKDIAQYILTRMKGIHQESQVLLFLHELSAKWSCFRPVLEIERVRLTQQKGFVI